MVASLSRPHKTVPLEPSPRRTLARAASAAGVCWMILLAGSLCLPARGFASTCPRAFVGDAASAASIQIASVPPSGSSGTVSGVARNLDTSKLRVAGWAHTDRYYPQPLLTNPFTCVGANGSWSYFTNPFKRVIVLLVDDSYVAPAGPPPLPPSVDYHPATDRGVVAWAEIPPSRTVSFAGNKWWVKDSAPFATGPGPCVFSPSTSNVFVDADGFLHLRTVEQGGTWTCAEVVLDRSRGLGAYTFRVSSPLDTLDPLAVFGGFLFESPTREIDVECSAALTGLSNGCQYVVQPFATPGNRLVFPIPAGSTSHRIDWETNKIEFLSWRGFAAYPPDPQDVIQSFVYAGPDIPPPGHERMRMNLWLFGGAAPATGSSSEVVLRSFEYSCPAAGCPATASLAAVLPLSRSHQAGTLLTAFATMINTGPEFAVRCRVQPPASAPASLGPFLFQTTDPATNLPTGVVNTPATIAPGDFQSFVFGFTPTGAIPETVLPIQLTCDNTSAPHIAGVNDLVLVTDLIPVPDTIAMIATLSGDGVVRIADPAGLQVFSVATANVGATGSITVSADTGGVPLPLVLTVCETDSATGVCRTPRAPSVTVSYAADTTRSFAFFAQATGSIPFDPGTNRVFVRLKENGVTRGATSAAVCAAPSPGC